MNCESCDVCCRFLDNETPLGPTGISLVPCRDRFTQPLLTAKEALKQQEGAGFICSRFDPKANRCRDYENRPLDCRIYPFVVMWDKDYKNIVLGLDPNCPHIDKSRKHKKYLLAALKDISPEYILRFQDNVEILEKLDVKVEPVLNKLLIGDKALFEGYAGQSARPASSYSFIANYIWTGLLGYYWTIIDGNFCLFCRTGSTIFMPIPPLGKGLSKKAVKGCFKLMNEENKNKKCSRIEEITRKALADFKELGCEIREKGREYIYRQKDLAGLAGDRYKAKRALCNYFEKNYRFEFREFRPDDKKGCLELFRLWGEGRLKAHKDDYYKALIEDSYLAHEKAMDRFRDLGLAARIIMVDNKISAYTFGYWLDDKTFVILFEITDLDIKGLSQFIFRKFCAEMGEAKFVNAMDDSGLDNIRKVKLSYHPVKIERTFCAYA